MTVVGSSCCESGLGDPNLTIEVGDPIPNFSFQTASVDPISITCSPPRSIDCQQIFAGKTIVLISVQGAFTPASDQYLSGFLQKYPELRERRVDRVVCVSVNDVYVMAYWAHLMSATDMITVLADGSGKFSKMIGMLQDHCSSGMGIRSKHHVMLVVDGIVKYVKVSGDNAQQGELDNGIDALLNFLIVGCRVSKVSL